LRPAAHPTDVLKAPGGFFQRFERPDRPMSPDRHMVRLSFKPLGMPGASNKKPARSADQAPRAG
jgi:hypothetical protein